MLKNSSWHTVPYKYGSGNGAPCGYKVGVSHWNWVIRWGSGASRMETQSHSVYTPLLGWILMTQIKNVPDIWNRTEQMNIKEAWTFWTTFWGLRMEIKVFQTYIFLIFWLKRMVSSLSFRVMKYVSMLWNQISVSICLNVKKSDLSYLMYSRNLFLE